MKREGFIKKILFFNKISILKKRLKNSIFLKGTNYGVIKAKWESNEQVRK